MLVDKLGRFPMALEDHDEGVESCELATELDPAGQVEGDRDLLATELVQEAIL
jgi:hypothetical protein